jgi:hypothetical protein
MDQVTLGYSTKNVPVPSQKDYLQRLISSADKFMKSLRWRTFFFLNPESKPNKKETYGFPSTKSPPKLTELKQFEDGILDIIQGIEFKDTTTKFQKQLSKDCKDIRESDELIIPADKTTNFYKLQPEQHNRLLHENVTKDYKKAPPNLEKDINIEDKRIAAALELDDRINCIAKNETFITLKDHKPSFNNKPTCRLINPTKSEIGKISKSILERINSATRAATQVNQWKNTSEVINWYNQIANKGQYSFICFDICEFYPSISKELLTKALDFAGTHSNITEQERNIIIHTKKSILYSAKEPWCKKPNTDFDVTMGSFDGAETCEMIGLYLLSQLQHLDIDVGLYRDDGLAVCKKTPRQIEKIKKEICKTFTTNNLRITIEANLKSVDFLDITMDLRNGKYKPYMKPNNTPLYVHSESNHPPNIIKNIPESINRRLTTISSDETTFNHAIPAYKAALNNSGYTYNLKYDPPPSTNNNKSNNQRRNRKRKITWFNPPYSTSAKTNVARKFLNLIDICFPKEHQLHKLINRNTIKVSYSCMPNVKKVITNHNRSILKKSTQNEASDRNCNCRRKNECPLNGKCLTESVIYQASVKREDNNKEETYIGLTENTFKIRYNGHTNSFRNESKRNSTTLSSYIWTLKDKKIAFTLQWKIVAKGSPYSPAAKSCNLCTKEKYYIICRPHMATLNSRNELASDCRHRRKYLLCSI